MRLLTYTFVALVLPLAAITRGQPGARRALWVAALAAFTVSALHLTELAPARRLVADRARRPSRVAPARARHPVPGLPICLRRSVSEARARTPRRRRDSGVQRDRDSSATTRRRLPTSCASVLATWACLSALWVGTSLLYPPIRRASAWFVDTIVLRRADYATLASGHHATHPDSARRARRCSPMSARCCSRP